MVVYLDCPVVVRGHSVWFGGALDPVERYVFDRSALRFLFVCAGGWLVLG